MEVVVLSMHVIWLVHVLYSIIYVYDLCLYFKNIRAEGISQLIL